MAKIKKDELKALHYLLRSGNHNWGTYYMHLLAKHDSDPHTHSIDLQTGNIITRGQAV